MSDHSDVPRGMIPRVLAEHPLLLTLRRGVMGFDLDGHDSRGIEATTGRWRETGVWFKVKGIL